VSFEDLVWLECQVSQFPTHAPLLIWPTHSILLLLVMSPRQDATHCAPQNHHHADKR